MYSYGLQAFNSDDIGKITFHQDIEDALYWYEQAALNGNPKAYMAMAFMYDYGKFVSKKYGDKYSGLFALKPDKSEAINYYNYAARHGIEKAIERLAKRDTTETRRWDEKYRKATTVYTDFELNSNFYQARVRYNKSNEPRVYFTI